MRIDLADKTTRFLVEEYVNKICHFTTEEELDWNVHKLVHTFQVVEMARRLISHTKSILSESTKKHILYAALLHDIGRCHEFKNGKRLLKVDHGKIGASLIKRHFPNMKIEAETTSYHNKLASDKDPKVCQIVLDYVRDADMLANTWYQVHYPSMWLKRVCKYLPCKQEKLKIDKEILCAAKEHRCADSKKVVERTFLSLVLSQLCWYYGLKTRPAIHIAQNEQLFARLKQIIYTDIIPQMVVSKKEQVRLVKEIEDIFPNDSLT